MAEIDRAELGDGRSGLFCALHGSPGMSRHYLNRIMANEGLRRAPPLGVVSRELIQALEGEGIRWFTETDISVAKEPVLLHSLARSGCAQILIGLESPQLSALGGVEQKTNWKQKQSEHYKDSIKRIQDAGVTVNGYFVLGLDDSDASSFDAIYEFVEETNFYEVQVTIMTPFPGTPLYERLLKENRILNPGAWELSTLFDVNFQSKNMSVEELENGFRDLVGRIYDSDFIEQRRKQFLKRRNELRQDRAVEQRYAS